MAKSLIITEKPSVAQEFARILGVSGRNDGYIENSDYVITWCVGHLVEMVYPEVYDEKYKKWKVEDLPFLPKEYKYDVIPAVSKQYDVVHKILILSTGQGMPEKKDRPLRKTSVCTAVSARG